jgi:hypothetical protein
MSTAVSQSSKKSIQNIKTKTPLEHYAVQAKRKHSDLHIEHLEEAVDQFCKDIIFRKSSVFVCEEKIEQHDHLTAIKEVYFNYLAKNPIEIGRAVKNLCCSNLHRTVLKAKGFPPTTLFAAPQLQALFSRYLDSEMMDEVMSKCLFTDEQLNALANKSACSREQVAALMPAKVLEIAAAMNQSLLFETYVLVQSHFQRDLTLAIEHAEKARYIYTPNLKSLTIDDFYTISLNNSFAETSLPQIKMMLPMVQLKAVMTIPSLTDNSRPVTKHMQDIRFSWRVTPAILKNFADILPNQASYLSKLASIIHQFNPFA